MALKLNAFDDVVALGSDSATGARGFLTRIINRTGSASVLGSVVSNCPSEDNGACLQFNEYDAIGVVAESGTSCLTCLNYGCPFNKYHR